MESNAIFNILSEEERNTLENLLKDFKVYQTMKAESEKEQKRISGEIKPLLDKIGMNGTNFFRNFSITYKEQTKQIADTDKMKQSGIFEAFSKEQKTKPLTVR